MAAIHKIWPLNEADGDQIPLRNIATVNELRTRRSQLLESIQTDCASNLESSWDKFQHLCLATYELMEQCFLDGQRRIPEYAGNFPYVLVGYKLGLIELGEAFAAA